MFLNDNDSLDSYLINETNIFFGPAATSIEG